MNKSPFSIIFFSFLIILNNSIKAQSTTVTFNFTGAAQTWVVPPCVTSISVTVAGAKGGGTGGNGAVVTGNLSVTSGQTLQINVGGLGACPGAGFNGGGTGGNANTAANRGCGGGGASDIRVTPYNLTNRIIVASGGGGMGGGTSDAAGGNGGCATGIAGTSPFGQGGGGASQSAGGIAGPPWNSSGNYGTAGTLGVGGNGGTDPCYNFAPGGGGGGGYYGGGGGGSDCFNLAPYGGGSGGGGSSLIPSGGGCTLGSNNGAGYVTITYTAGSATATATNTGPYCVGATIQLNASAGTSFSWTGPNGFTSTLQNPTILNSTSANAGIYNLSVTTAGCVATSTTTVVINPLPTVSAGSNQTVCAGASVTLTGSGASNYTWNNGVTNGVAFVPAATTTYTVTGTSTTGCINTSSVTVTVNPIPSVNAGVDQSVCSGTNVTLSGSGATTYSWNNGVTNGFAFSQPVGTVTYTVTGTTSGCTNTDQVIVTVIAMPSVNAGVDQTVCAGTNVTLSGSGATTYSWNNGISDGVAFSQAVGSVTYTVTGTSSGCTNTDQVIVTVNPSPVVNAGVDQAVCDGTNVTLNGSGATTYSWNNGVSNGVAFTQPVGTVTYTVTGTSLGCTNTDQVDVTVNSIPTVNAGVDQTVCSGTNVTLTGSGATTYSWNNGISNGVAFSQPVGTVTYTVTGTTSGCTNTDQVIVTVNPSPAVNAGVDQTVCAGTNVTLTGTGATTYSWNNGVSNGVAFSQPVGTVTYTVTGTSLGCTNTDQVIVTVNPIPTVNAGVDQTVCAGTNIILSGSGATTYSWNNGVSNGVAFTQPVGTVTYTVIGTSLGCTNTDQVIITVNPLPNVNGGIDQIVCNGTSVTLTATGASTYSWNNGISNGVAFTQANGTITYTVTGTTSGCTNTDQVIVTVNPIPAVNAGLDQSVCYGTMITLSGSGATTYSWDNGVTNGLAFSQALGTVTYTVTGTSLGCVNTDQVNVTVNEIPMVGFIPDITIGCAPLTVNFTNSDPNASSCLWTFSDGTSTSGCGTVSHTFTQAGCHDVTLMMTASNGCTNSLSASNLICLEAKPIPSFIASSPIMNEFNPNTNFLNTTIGASSYSWNFGDNSPNSAVVNPSHSYLQTGVGDYVVTLIAYSPLGCVDSVKSIVKVVGDIIFYIPNSFTPDNDMFNQTFQPIFTSGFDPYDFNLFIFNRWGEIIFESHNAEIGWDGTYGGKLVQEGTYTWKIEFKTDKNDERKMVVGNVNMFR